jgi:hypothetical protein
MQRRERCCSFRMQRDSGAPWDGAPWEVHAIAAPVLHADDAVAALAVSACW